jgi:type IV fimbrial biogenesis protein FimT
MNPRVIAPRRRFAGMTMIELLTTISIAVILGALAVPSYRYVTYANRASAEVNALLGDMQFARTEAMKEGQPITVCSSVNATSAAPTCSNATTWQGGWVVFSDLNGNGVPNANEILRVQGAFAVAGDTFVADNNVTQVQFNRQGFAPLLPPTAAGYITVTLHTTPQGQQWTRCLQIMTTGLVTTERYGDPQGNCL